eukprot:1162402-Rhodomonas_salina.1
MRPLTRIDLSRVLTAPSFHSPRCSVSAYLSASPYRPQRPLSTAPLANSTARTVPVHTQYHAARTQYHASHTKRLPGPRFQSTSAQSVLRFSCQPTLRTTLSEPAHNQYRAARTLRVGKLEAGWYLLGRLCTAQNGLVAAQPTSVPDMS